MKLAPAAIGTCSAAGIRPQNEDRAGFLLAPDGSAALLVLADGMGGHAGGEVASEIAVRTLLEAFERYGFAEAEPLLEEAIRAAHARIRRQAARDAACEGMGTTLVVGVLREGEVLVGHVGDSRALQFRPPHVRRLTQDHLYITEVLGLPEREAKEHPKGHVLSQALGVPGDLAPTLNRFSITAGDWVVLCTDGVHGPLAEPQLSELLADGTPGEVVGAMVREAIRSGSRDNCSVVAAQVPA